MPSPVMRERRRPGGSSLRARLRKRPVTIGNKDFGIIHVSPPNLVRYDVRQKDGVVHVVTTGQLPKKKRFLTQTTQITFGNKFGASVSMKFPTIVQAIANDLYI